MADQEKSTTLPSFRTFFLRGLGILLPSVLTIYLLVAGYQFLSEKIAEPINQGLRWSVVTALDWPEVKDQDFHLDFDKLDAEQKNDWNIQKKINQAKIVEEYQTEVNRLLNQSVENFKDENPGWREKTELSVKEVEKFEKFRRDALEVAERQVVGKYYPLEKVLEDRDVWVKEIARQQTKAQRLINLKSMWDEYSLGGWSYLNLIGLIIAAFLIYLAGRLLGSFFGKRIYQKAEQLLTGLPGFKQIYPYVKQVTDFLFGGDNKDKVKFNKVVAVEYPRKGLWSIGLVTGETLSTIQDNAGVECVTVFVPSSPTPFTGYVITVPVADTMDLPISIDEALRFTVSGGVIIPDHQVIEHKEKELPENLAS